MTDFYEALTSEQVAFIQSQPVFFVATAAAGARINVSPKGMDTLRVLDANTLAYLDLTGSGNETAAHVAADGRLTMMFCAFGRQPLVLRLYGRGEVLALDSAGGRELRGRFPYEPGARQIIVLHVESLQTSCGYAVPLMEVVGERDTLRRYFVSKGEDVLRSKRLEHNAVSIDGLPAPGYGPG